MDDQLRNEIFEAWNIDGLPLDQQIVKLFEKVRDIPFLGESGSREPRVVYEKIKEPAQVKILLKELYEGIGVKTKDMVCLQRWKDEPGSQMIHMMLLICRMSYMRSDNK